jgi:hypothetical protein
LTRGLALYQSLKDNCQAFRLWVLCLDDDAYTALNKLSFQEVQPISLKDFEFGDERLLQAKKNRSPVEYYFTCTPSLALFILNHHLEVNLITYLDADLFFFADPAQLFAEMDGKSIAIIGHRFPARLSHLEINGIYNVGWVSFRCDENGLECLHWWRDLCLEWCYARIEGDRFADQKYLDRFPDKFGDEIVLRHKGANVAPWNIENYILDVKENNVYVDGQPLLFFHFQGFKQVISWVYDLGLYSYGVRPFREIIDYIYLPYIKTLKDLPRDKPSLRTLRGSQANDTLFTHIKAKAKWWVRFLLGIFRRQFSLITDKKVNQRSPCVNQK